MKRVFIVHGWSGYPEEGWFPWLKGELLQRGISVTVPSMPNPDEPIIDTWVSHLTKVVGMLDEETYFVGHSIGCQTILRYIEQAQVKIGGAIFVAGWFHLTNIDTEEEKRISKPWLETAIDLEAVSSLLSKSVAIFSNDDPLVPLNINSSAFKEALGAQIVIEEAKGHIAGTDGIVTLPSVLEALLRLMNK